MQLAAPVTVTINDMSVEFLAIEPAIIDDCARKIVLARLHPAMRPLLLWRGEEYDAVGDWTQAQAETRIAELLGDNPAAQLQALVFA